MDRDVLHGQVYMVQIAALRQLFDLAEALHSHQLVAEPAQGAAADAAAAQVLHAAFFSQ